MSKKSRASRAFPLLLAAACSVASACLSPQDLAAPEEDARHETTALDEAAQHLADNEEAAPAAAAAKPELGGFVPGELIVKLDADTALEAGRAVELGGVRLMPVRPLRAGAWHVLLLDGAAAHAAVATGRPIDDAALAAAEQLTLSSRDAIARSRGVLAAHVNLTLEFSATPADPLYWSHQRWNYEAVRLPAAWDYGGGHAGIRLAIIDSEDDQNFHPDLYSKWSDGRSFTTVPQLYHHGAHVAGIAGGAADGNLGVGVCWNCRLLPYRMSGNALEIEQAIDRAAGEDLGSPRAEVINLSMNRRYRTRSFDRLQCSDGEVEIIGLAIADAVARGVTVVVSAGNFGDQGPAFPANCPDVISVAAIQPGGTLASYSNRGAHSVHGAVTLAAPGGGGSGNSQYGDMLAEMQCPLPHTFSSGAVDPFSGTVGVVAPFASYTDPIDPKGYCYRHLSGTSMSAPHVTGTVGLMKSRNLGLSPAQIKDVLARTAQPATACPAGSCGAGLLDAHAATRYALDGGVPLAAATPVVFGNVAVGASANSGAQITSNGSAVLGLGSPMQILGGGGQIEFAYPSGACTSGVSCARSANLPPGTPLSIPLRCRPTAVGAIAATLRLPSNRFHAATGAVDAPLEIPLSCTGFIPPPDIQVTPLALAFGDVAVGATTPARLVTVRNAGGGTLAVTASESSADYALTCQSGCTCADASCTASLTANQSATLAVTFTPQARGARDATLTLATPADPDEPSTSVTLTGTGLQALLQVQPMPLQVGGVMVGATGTASGVLRNAGNLPLRVTQMTLSSSPAGVFSFTCGGQPCAPPFDLAAGASRALEVRCTPPQSGPYTANLVITSTAPNTPYNALLQCQGFAPRIETSPSGNVAFGTVTVGTSAHVPFGIHNANLAVPLTWSASLPIGTPFTLACASSPGCTCAGRTCSGTNSQSLRLTFSPTSDGAAATTLSIQSNDPLRPSLSRAITGTGLTWIAREVPATPDVAVPRGGSAELRVRNRGTAPVALSDVRITGAAPSAFSFTGPRTGTLNPNATQAWSLSCTTANATATFEVHTNAPGTPILRAPLRCVPL